jgi:hypothetical protein
MSVGWTAWLVRLVAVPEEVGEFEEDVARRRVGDELGKEFLERVDRLVVEERAVRTADLRAAAAQRRDEHAALRVRRRRQHELVERGVARLAEEAHRLRHDHRVALELRERAGREGRDDRERG